ncbi:MAG TPA: hypothetical protein V6D37_10025 [Candidatus Sericytochromatia bacterium]
MTTLEGDRFSQTGTGDRTRASSHEIELQRFDHNYPTAYPRSWLSWVVRAESRNFSTSPLYSVSWNAIASA